jgi:DNA-binding MarR family transcriptional regulator
VWREQGRQTRSDEHRVTIQTVAQGPQGGRSVSEYQRTAELRTALRRFLRVSEKAARRHGLTPRQHNLLLMIKGAPDGTEMSTVSELCDRLQLAQSTVTELVQRAGETGLVKREPSGSDGRVAHISLTPLGEKRLAALHEELADERELLLEYIEQRGHAKVSA